MEEYWVWDSNEERRRCAGVRILRSGTQSGREYPAGSQSLLQLLDPSLVSAPVAQARAETSWLCKGQVPSPLHNILTSWLGGAEVPGVLAPFKRGSQDWLNVRGCSEIFQ